MKRKCKELKRISRGNLCGFYGVFILAIILVSMIPSFILTPFNSTFQNEVLNNSLRTSTLVTYIAASLLMTLVAAIFGAGQFKLHLNHARKLPAQIGDLFSQFKKRPDRFIVGTLLILLISIVVFIPMFVVFVLSFAGILQNGFLFSEVSTLLIILLLAFFLIAMVLNIYISLRFSLFIILLVDHPDYSAVEALKTSWKLMSGNVGRLFYISLSFIGLYLLGALTLGAAYLWIEPYRIQTVVQFYLDVTGQIDQQLADERKRNEEMGPVMEY